MTYEEFCKVPGGAVIIDDNGYDYIMGDERLWPSNPNEPFSVIRYHKFSFEGFRNATEEETKAFFDALQANGYKWNPETLQAEELPKEFDELLDKTAEEYGEENQVEYWSEAYNLHTSKEDLIAAFKAGVKWLAEQGIIYEDKIYPTSYENEPTEFCLDGGEEIRLLTEAVNKGTLKQGDKVTVQIRKK